MVIVSLGSTRIKHFRLILLAMRVNLNLIRQFNSLHEPSSVILFSVISFERQTPL